MDMATQHVRTLSTTAGKPRRRVALWIDELSDEFLNALLAEGVDVVAVFQASHPAVPSYSVYELFYGGEKFFGLPPGKAPPAWIDHASFRLYARCVQRIGIYPASDFFEAFSGGIVLPGDIEDWARVHLDRALQILEATSAEEVWFAFNPHLGVDNMLALAAVRTARKCLVFSQIRFAPKFSWKLLGPDRNVSAIAAGFKPWHEGAVEPNLFYMREQRAASLTEGMSTRFDYLWRRLIRGDWSALSSRLYGYARKRRWWTWMFVLELLDRRTRPWTFYRRAFRKRFERERKQQNREALSFISEDFIYFPLHLEPEENVHVLGGDYTNQLDAVVALHDILPEGWSILLKENPKQTFQNRGQPFHDRLRALPNVRFVRGDTPSGDLIARSRLVATITGTAGYEALLSGKPCIYFGEAWFADLPGATPFSAELDLERLSARRISKLELDEAINVMLGALADGLAHPRYAGIHGKTHDLVTLYAEAARSMVAISESYDDVVATY